MLLSTPVTFVLSVFAVGGLCSPLVARDYSSELKDGVAHIVDLWAGLGRLAQALPATNKTGTTPDSTVPLTDKIVELGFWTENQMNGIMKRNKAFTNTKWSDEYVADLRKIVPVALNTLEILQSRVAQVEDIGGWELLGRFYDSSMRTRSGYYDWWRISRDFLMLFVDGAKVLDQLEKETGLQAKFTQVTTTYSNAYFLAYYKYLYGLS